MEKHADTITHSIGTH